MLWILLKISHWDQTRNWTGNPDITTKVRADKWTHRILFKVIYWACSLWTSYVCCPSVFWHLNFNQTISRTNTRAAPTAGRRYSHPWNTAKGEKILSCSNSSAHICVFFLTSNRIRFSAALQQRPKGDELELMCRKFGLSSLPFSLRCWTKRETIMKHQKSSFYFKYTLKHSQIKVQRCAHSTSSVQISTQQ